MIFKCFICYGSHIFLRSKHTTPKGNKKKKDTIYNSNCQASGPGPGQGQGQGPGQGPGPGQGSGPGQGPGQVRFYMC